MSDPKDLRDSVRDYRDPNTSDQDRADIKAEWAQRGIPNQFAALLRAADIEKQKGRTLDGMDCLVRAAGPHRNSPSQGRN